MNRNKIFFIYLLSACTLDVEGEYDFEDTEYGTEVYHEPSDDPQDVKIDVEYIEIPITVHVSENLYNPESAIQKIENDVDIANELWKDSKLEFFIDNVIYTDYDIFVDEKKYFSELRNRSSNSINVFLMENIRFIKDGKYVLYGGYASGDLDTCRPVVLVDDTKSSEYTLSHEIGHILGLGHSDDRSNLMYPDDMLSFDHVITDKQVEKTEKVGFKYLTMCAF